MIFLDLNSETESRWNEYVFAHPDATIYHTIEWMSILSDVFKYKDCSILVSDNDAIHGVMPLYRGRLGFKKVLATMPLRDRGGILASDETSAFMLMSHALSRMRSLECDALIIKQYDPPSWKIHPEYSLQQPLMTTAIDLNGHSDALWDKIKPQARNKIRQAEKNAINVTISDAKEDLDSFCRLFHRTRKRLGVPSFPADFFRAIHEKIILRGWGKTILARFNGIPVAGMIIFTFRGTAIDAYSAWDRESNKLRANDLLVWKTMEWCRQNNFTTFEFGADSPDQKTLLDYKEKWGAQARPVSYYTVGRNGNEFKLFNSGNTSLSLMRMAIRIAPNALYNLAGRIAPHFYC